METDYKKEYSYKKAQKRVKEIKGFYTHLAVYIVVNAAIFILITRGSGIVEGLSNIMNYSTPFFWGIGLTAHWASVFGTNFIFNKNWEEKKIKELMQQESKKKWQ